METTIKTNRKGLTKAKWIEVIKACLKAAGVENPKIEFTSDGINVEYFTIGFAEWQQEKENIFGQRVIIRGYELIQWRSTPYSYHEPQDVYDVSMGNFETPYQIISAIAQNIFEERLSGELEGFQMEDVAKEEEKYVEQMIENQGESLPEPNRDMSDDYRDRMERHNRQVLSRL